MFIFLSAALLCCQWSNGVIIYYFDKQFNTCTSRTISIPSTTFAGISLENWTRICSLSMLVIWACCKLNRTRLVIGESACKRTNLLTTTRHKRCTWPIGKSIDTNCQIVGRGDNLVMPKNKLRFLTSGCLLMKTLPFVHTCFDDRNANFSL